MHLLLQTLTRVVGPKYTLHKLASEEATQLLRMLTSHTLAYTCLKSLVLERMLGYEIHVLNERSGVPPRPEVRVDLISRDNVEILIASPCIDGMVVVDSAYH
jgi:hypothetical protein